MPDPTYRAEWCQTLDKDDPDKLVDLWENKNITHVLDSYTKGKEDDWWFNLIQHALKDKGNVLYDGCGVFGSHNCNFDALDCDEFADRGMGAEYWILTAMAGEFRRHGSSAESRLMAASQPFTPRWKSHMSSFKTRRWTTCLNL